MRAAFVRRVQNAGVIPQNRPSPLYQCGLALVTVAMLILPCLYAALTALAGFGVHYFATHYFTEIWAWPVGHSKYGVLLKVVCAFTPLLVGAAIVIAMVKPLFARRPARMQPLALNPEIDTRAYEFVHGICALVGARAPRRIELDCDLNASASFDRGLRGFFKNDLILTLGLPLIAGLTQRELAGVLAHEFGHFRQGAGMRLSYLIRRVNGWFARVVYERDAWDAALESWAAGDSAWVGLMLGCARFGVWLSRRLLWVLMIAGHGICALLLRQMEYDADRVEIAVAGSAAFESTMLKLAALGSVFADLHREMQRIWRKQLQLPDNLPVLVGYRAAQLPAEKRAQLEASAGLAKTGLLDTHPSTADRVQRARQLGESGGALSEAPARELFEGFETVSRLVTLAHYQDDLNVPITPDFLIPLEQLILTKSEPTPAPAAAPAVPMMRYDPAAFRAPEPPTTGATGQ